MTNAPKKGAEEARNQLPDLLDAAEEGRSTIITKHGRPVAALVPVSEYVARGRQHTLLSLEGSGSGMWGTNSSRALRKMRDEWSH